MINELLEKTDTQAKTFFMISASEHGIPFETLGLYGLGRHINDYTMVVFDEPGVLIHNEHFKDALISLEENLEQMEKQFDGNTQVVRGSDIISLRDYDRKFEDLRKNKHQETKLIRSSLPAMVKYELAVMAELADNGFTQKLSIPCEGTHDNIYQRARDDLIFAYTPKVKNIFGSEVNPYIVGRPNQNPIAFAQIPRLLLTESSSEGIRKVHAAQDGTISNYEEIATLGQEMQGLKPEKLYTNKDRIDRIAQVLSAYRGEPNPREIPMMNVQ